MKLKSLFSKKNSQRVLSLVCAVLIGAVCMICCAAPAYASFDSQFDYQAPFGFLFNDVLTYEGFPFSAEFPFSVSTSASLTDYNFVLFDNTGLAFGQSLDSYSYVYLWASGWLGDGAFWLYSPGLPDADSEMYRTMEMFLSYYGTFYLLHDSYFFKDSNLFLPNLLTQQFDFASNGIVFEGITCSLGNMYYIADGSNVLVYRGGSWVDQAYRNISLTRYVPNRAIFVDFWLENQFVPPSFLDRLTSGFTAAIGWLGHFFTSLFTSDLALAFVLVSVGFGLALLSFGWRWIRRFLWGH